MSRQHSYLASAINAITSYKPGEPLVHHLKRFFAANKKYGSKDRKQIASLCYNYFRTGNALKDKSAEERIVASTFLCSSSSNDFLEEMNPTFNDSVTKSKAKKIASLQITSDDFFPFKNELGEEIHKDNFALSFLEQPHFFLRIRPGKEIEVIEKLTENKIPFEEITTSCVAIQQGFKTEQFFALNKDVVVQDCNSQRVFNYLQRQDVYLKKDIKVWDCCAASGGKSILLYDILHGHVDLQVSDVRVNILNNLRNRFKEAGIKKYNAFKADLMQKDGLKISDKFDVIICDAPCSGSGTWARTPEQLSFFKKDKIDEYAVMQLKIASTAIRYLNKQGLFFYITCSAFKKENEAIVHQLTENFSLQVLHMEYLIGYETFADTMFVAVLSK